MIMNKGSKQGILNSVTGGRGPVDKQSFIIFIRCNE